MGKILVVGCTSLDTIHLSCGKTVSTVGGAGLYTALAAQKAGADVTLFAPRPEPMPDVLAAAAEHIGWIGPSITIDQMPSLEIAHHGHGNATLVGASWGAEQLLTPQAFTTYGKQHFDCIHIAALSSGSRQYEFVRFFQESVQLCKISIGTYARAINADLDTVSKLLTEADFFFMNHNEAKLLGIQADNRSHLFKFENRPDKIVFITDGARGVTIVTATSAEQISATPVNEVDPTGAGDTFCGATLAIMADGAGAVDAAQYAVKVAAKVVEQPGPAALL